MILSKISDAVCLVLDERIDEFDRIQTEWNKYNVNVRPFIVGNGKKDIQYDRIDDCVLPPLYNDSIMYPTWLERTNAYDAWKSHREILYNFCQYKHEGYLLLLEDDSFIEDDFEQVIQTLPHNFSPDMLYFGCYHYENSYEKVSENLVRLKGSGGWHGVMIKRGICAKLLQYLPLGPYDWICGQFIHSRYVCYATYPCIVSQKDNMYSHVEGQILKKPSRYKL